MCHILTFTSILNMCHYSNQEAGTGYTVEQTNYVVKQTLLKLVDTLGDNYPRAGAGQSHSSCSQHCTPVLGGLQPSSILLHSY